MREEDGRRCFARGSLRGAGRILLYDDMETICKWGPIPGWTSASAEASGEGVYYGNKSLRVYVYRDLPNGVYYAYAGRYIPWLPGGIIRAECIFRRGRYDWTQEPAIRSSWGARIVLDFIYGGYRYRGGVGWNAASTGLEYLGESGFWFWTGEVQGAGDVGDFHRISMDVPVGGGNYIGAVFDAQNLSVNGLSMDKTVYSGPSRAIVLVSVGTYEVEVNEIFYDEVVVRSLIENRG